MASAVPPAEDSWVVAIHQTAGGGTPLAAGVVIDDRRVLTCGHQVLRADVDQTALWVAFPFTDLPDPGSRPPKPSRRLVKRVITPGGGVLDEDRDVAVLVLAEQVPTGVTPARLRCPTPKALVGTRWWAFGFPAVRGGRGSTADGVIGAALPGGWVRIDTDSRYQVEPGFSGSGLWSPDYEAVVGLVAQADDRGNGTAFTMREAVACLSEAGLRLPAERSSVTDSGEQALTAWGWRLRKDPEGRRHWLPRARGVSVDSERGYRFRGRTAALRAIQDWLDRAQDDRHILVVTGDPGSGKSAVLGRIVTTADADAARLLPESDAAVRATQGSVACAVHAKGKTALEVAAEIARAASAALPEQLEDFTPALRDALADRGGRRFNVIIDALDESAEVRAVISKVALPIAETCGDVGAQVVVGSRRRHESGDLLAAFGVARTVIDLDEPQFYAEEDLAAYALATLQLARPAGAGNPYTANAIAGRVAARIAELSDGNFLVAGLTAQTHGLYDVTAVEPAVLWFTGKVADAMRDYVQRIPAVAGVAAEDILTALAFAEAPGMPAILWHEVIRALGFGDVPAVALSRFARSSAANFLVESSAPDGDAAAFRLFHQALDDALLDARAQVATRSDDEQLLTNAFIAVGRGSEWQHAPDYLLRSLSAHADRAGLMDELLTDDGYLNRSDLRRLLPLAGRAVSPPGQQRTRMLRLTPSAVGADPQDRAALFSVTETIETLGQSGQTQEPGAPYTAAWARISENYAWSILEGHSDGVGAVCAFTLEGRPLLATGSADRTIRIWDPADGTQVSVLHGHTDRVDAVCPLSAGHRTLLASGGRDGTIRIWDPVTGGSLRTIPSAHPRGVHGLCTFTLEGRTLLASCGDDWKLRIWDPASGSQRSAFGSAKHSICAVVLDGQVKLASDGGDDTLRVWDPATGTQQQYLTGHEVGVQAVCSFTLEGRTWLASGARSRDVRIWDPASGATRWVMSSPSWEIYDVCAFTLVGRTLLACVDKETVRIGDPLTATTTGVLYGHTGPVRSICAFDLDGRTLLASGSDDGTVRIWDPARTPGKPPLSVNANLIDSACTFTLDGSTALATGSSYNGKVQVWDLATGTEQAVMTGGGWVTGLCSFVLNGQPLLAGSNNGTRAVNIWDPATSHTLSTLPGDRLGVQGICAFRLGGRPMVASAEVGGIRVWDPETGTQYSLLTKGEYGAGAISVCAFNRGGRPLLAAGSSWDSEIRIWDPASGTVRAVLKGHEQGGVRALCELAVKRRVLLASGGPDRTVRIWNPATGFTSSVLRGHTAEVRAVCAVHLGNRTFLASGSLDRTIRIWAPRARAALLTVPVYSPVHALCFADALLIAGTTAGVLAIRLNPDVLAPGT